MTNANRMDGDLDIDVASLFGSLWRKKFRILLLSTVDGRSDCCCGVGH